MAVHLWLDALNKTAVISGYLSTLLDVRQLIFLLSEVAKMKDFNRKRLPAISVSFQPLNLAATRLCCCEELTNLVTEPIF